MIEENEDFFRKNLRARRDVELSRGKYMGGFVFHIKSLGLKLLQGCHFLWYGELLSCPWGEGGRVG